MHTDGHHCANEARRIVRGRFWSADFSTHPNDGCYRLARWHMPGMARASLRLSYVRCLGHAGRAPGCLYTRVRLRSVWRSQGRELAFQGIGQAIPFTRAQGRVKRAEIRACNPMFA